ncbi:MAG: hypothetical protein Q4B50_05635, partial [Bacillota bacterium]|nr:hypothetical protein [Bacillota bacterium]
FLPWLSAFLAGEGRKEAVHEKTKRLLLRFLPLLLAGSAVRGCAGQRKPPGGLRHCINSAALRFVPRGKPEEEACGGLLHLFG